jgi:hypothetical protein
VASSSTLWCAEPGTVVGGAEPGTVVGGAEPGTVLGGSIGSASPIGAA